MNDQASLTARMAAYGRAFHNADAARPVFADTLARALFTDSEYAAQGQALLQGMAFFAPERVGAFPDTDAALRWLVNTQIAPTPLARARFCEDALRTAVRTGTRQYVLLGAGWDTFAWREPVLARRCPVFEVDHPLTQADKRCRLARAGLPVPETFHFVPLDFSTGDLAEALCRAGFDPRQKTLFAWLGVNFYLTLPQIGGMLTSLSALSSPGSGLVFDFAGPALFASPVRRVQNMLAMAAAGGEPMQACFAERDLMGLLQRHGFLLYERLTPAQIQRRYFSGQGELTAFEEIHLAHAVYRP
ncbi:MAG: class I SAM-dependent methyltransferase [Gemmiger sp.]